MGALKDTNGQTSSKRSWHSMVIRTVLILVILACGAFLVWMTAVSWSFETNGFFGEPGQARPFHLMIIGLLGLSSIIFSGMLCYMVLKPFSVERSLWIVVLFLFWFCVVWFLIWGLEGFNDPFLYP